MENDKKEYFISKEKVSEIQSIYERKQALEDLCLTLCEKREFVSDFDYVYKRMVEDQKKCISDIEKFWNYIKENSGLRMEEGKQFYLDFETGKVTVR